MNPPRNLISDLISDPPRNLRVLDFRDLDSRPRTSRPRNLPRARIKNSQRPPQNTRDKGNLIFHSYSKTDVRAPCGNVMKIKKGGELHGSAVQAAVDDLSDMVVVDARKSTGRDIILILNLTVNFEFLITCLHTGLVGIVRRIMFVEIG